jgi:RNA polymerase sigma-70 factor, ECF subfamily
MRVKSARIAECVGRGIRTLNDTNLQHEQFVRLFSAHEAAIRAFVRRLIPTREDASDVMQDVAVTLWRKFNPSHGDLDFRKWAFWVARYEVLAWRRDKARDRHVLDAEVLAILADDALARDEALDIQREALETCLQKLAPSQRDLLISAYSSKDGVRGVAEQSGRSLQGLYQWLYRMRLVLLKCVRQALRDQSLGEKSLGERAT